MRPALLLAAAAALLTAGAGCGSALEAGGAAGRGPAPSAGEKGPKSPATYDVVLHRPRRVGDRHRVTSLVTKRQAKVVRVGGKAVKRESTERVLRFVGVERVTAVDARGRTTSAEYVIEELVAEQDQRRETVIAKGRVLRVTRGDPPVLALDQGALSDQAREDVAAVLAVDPPDRYTDDDIFGGGRKRAVGARWPVDRAKAAERFAAKGMSVGPSKLSGETTLVAATSEGGVPCMELSAGILAEVSAMPGLPPAAKVQRGSIRLDFHGLFPLDAALQPPRESSKMTGDFLVTLQAGGKRVELDLDLETTAETTRSPLR